jgi:hypothetical protein
LVSDLAKSARATGRNQARILTAPNDRQRGKGEHFVITCFFGVTAEGTGMSPVM